MKLWMSGEVMGDVGDQYAAARREITKEVNSILEAYSSALGSGQWAFIAIILDDDTNVYPEIRRYNKKDKSFEFRIKISHGQFKIASAAEQRGIILKAMIASLDDMLSLVQANNLSIMPEDISRLKLAIHKIGISRGWK